LLDRFAVELLYINPLLVYALLWWVVVVLAVLFDILLLLDNIDGCNIFIPIKHIYTN
jgi:hypothetical protein